MWTVVGGELSDFKEHWLAPPAVIKIRTQGSRWGGDKAFPAGWEVLHCDFKDVGDIGTGEETVFRMWNKGQTEFSQPELGRDRSFSPNPHGVYCHHYLFLAENYCFLLSLIFNCILESPSVFQARYFPIGSYHLHPPLHTCSSTSVSHFGESPVMVSVIWARTLGVIQEFKLHNYLVNNSSMPTHMAWFSFFLATILFNFSSLLAWILSRVFILCFQSQPTLVFPYPVITEVCLQWKPRQIAHLLTPDMSKCEQRTWPLPALLSHLPTFLLHLLHFCLCRSLQFVAIWGMTSNLGLYAPPYAHFPLDSLLNSAELRTLRHSLNP